MNNKRNFGKNQQASTRRGFIKSSATGMSAFWMGLGSLSGLANANNDSTSDKKLGIALVGLGGYSGGQLAPALQQTQHCYLAGIVTGTPAKEKVWQDKYGVPVENTYNYKNFDAITDNKAIDIVYVVLPNSMHAEYTIRAAQAGKHVISEKPMAVSVAECQQMIDATNKAGVKLGIGYRLHYDPFNLEMMRLGQKKIYGKVSGVEAEFRFKMNDLSQWRAHKELAGGGPLMDLGIYCIQGCIYTLGELPTSISARDTTIDKKAWTSVEGSLDVTMKFASGAVTHFKTSYEKEYTGKLIATAEKGEFGLMPAFIYNGLKGYTPEGPLQIQGLNQQAAQMDAFALNVMNNTKILVPGEMGMRDMFIIEKAYESMRKGGTEVSLAGIPQVQQLV